MISTSVQNFGWECPKCHRVFGPQITECFYCNKEEVTISYEEYNDVQRKGEE